MGEYLIIYRYLSRQLFTSTITVAFVLSIILISGRFIKYLAEAASGKLLGDTLVMIMAFRLPGFLELILPLSLFLGILLAYGQLYLNEEMTVLQACGISQQRIIGFTLVPALSMALVVGSFSLYLSPLGNSKVESLFAEMKLRSEFETLSPGRFHGGGSGTDDVIYVQNLSKDKTRMENIFIYQGEKVSQSKTGEVRRNKVVMVSKSGYRRLDKSTGEQYLELEKGNRYLGEPGFADYQVISFDKYTYKLQDASGEIKPHKVKSLSTLSLINSQSLIEKAELQWRLSLPLLVLIVSLLAVPLSKVTPRQGRFSKLLPSILLYLIYVVLLIAAQKSVGNGNMPAWLGLWLVHGVFFVTAVALSSWTSITMFWQKYRLKRANNSLYQF